MISVPGVGVSDPSLRHIILTSHLSYSVPTSFSSTDSLWYVDFALVSTVHDTVPVTKVISYKRKQTYLQYNTGSKLVV